MSEGSPSPPTGPQRPLPTPPGAARRYSDREVQQLLQRAVEMAPSTPGAPAAAGLTLQELEDIAREAGIDTANLRRAAAELDTRGTGGGAGRLLAGAPLRAAEERTLPFEVAPESFERLIPILQGADDAGQATVVGRTLSWQNGERSSNSRRVQLTVFVRGGQTTIRAEESFGALAGGVFGGFLGGFGGAGIGLGLALLSTMAVPGVVAAAIPLGVVGATYAACRFGFGRVVRGRGQALGRLVQEVAEELADAATETRDG